MDYSKLYKYEHKPDETEDNGSDFTASDDVQNESKTKNKIRLRILLYITLGSFLFILYVSNVIHVKSMLKEEAKLRRELEKIENENHLLNKKINELESPERITTIAIEKFMMIKPENPPKLLPKR